MFIQCTVQYKGHHSTALLNVHTVYFPVQESSQHNHVKCIYNILYSTQVITAQHCTMYILSVLYSTMSSHHSPVKCTYSVLYSTRSSHHSTIKCTYSVLYSTRSSHHSPVKCTYNLLYSTRSLHHSPVKCTYNVLYSTRS